MPPSKDRRVRKADNKQEGGFEKSGSNKLGKEGGKEGFKEGGKEDFKEGDKEGGDEKKSGGIRIEIDLLKVFGEL